MTQVKQRKIGLQKVWSFNSHDSSVLIGIHISWVVWSTFDIFGCSLDCQDTRRTLFGSPVGVAMSVTFHLGIYLAERMQKRTERIDDYKSGSSLISWRERSLEKKEDHIHKLSFFLSSVSLKRWVKTGDVPLLDYSRTQSNNIERKHESSPSSLLLFKQRRKFPHAIPVSSLEHIWSWSNRRREKSLCLWWWVIALFFLLFSSSFLLTCLSFRLSISLSFSIFTYGSFISIPFHCSLLVDERYSIDLTHVTPTVEDL